MRAMALATAVALLLAGPALADGPISTAPTAGPSAPQPTTPSPPLRSSMAADTGEDQPIALGPCGPEKVRPDGRLETAPHGEIEASVGSHGYRELAGVVCKPIGQNAAVTIGASQTQFDGRVRRR
ncbi:MAG: hypothetical protein ACXU82_19130 [Caulobacteraceae bacterium]